MDPYVFVTVGTTEFDEIIETVTSDEVIDLLIKNGYKKIVLQTGRGKYVVKNSRTDIQIECYDYKTSIRDDIKHATLVVSHAGAGSVLETLSLEKTLIVVINENLMDNHQMELAEKMADDGYLYHCTCETLLNTLKQKDLEQLKKMAPANTNLFGSYIDKLMGIDS